MNHTITPAPLRPRVPVTARPRFNLILRALLLSVLAALVFAAPARAQFGKNKITYQNFDWHVYRAPHFDVYYYPEEEAFLEQMVSYAESAYLELSQALQHEVQFRIPLIYYKTHREFEQTNITMSFIPEAVGAFAESLRKRMVLPIDLPRDDLYELLKHELVHIFEYSILFQDNLGREVRSRPPLWLMEGLASFMAEDEDSFDLMVIRDAVVHGLLPKVEQLDVLSFLTYRYGHAIFDFITEKFGKEGLRNFLLEFRKVLLSRNVSKAIKEAFGWEMDEFNRRFHKYLRKKYLPALLEKDEPADYGQEIAFRAPKDRGRFFSTFSPAIAPSGELIAALTTRYDDLDVVIFSAKDGEVVRNLTPGFTTDYQSITIEFLKGKKDLAWSPDGDRVAFFARKGSNQRLFIFHAVTGKKLDEVSVEVAKLASPDFSPDGKRVAFSGNLRGVVDIFELDLESRALRNLTQDKFYDSNPAWSADGKQLLYNRRIGAHEKLFMVDTSDPTRKTQLTFDDNHDVQPAFSADGNYVYFSSDYGKDGIFNIYSLDLEDGVVRRYTDVVVGNFAPVELGVDAKGRRTLAFVSYFKQRFQIYKMTLGEPLQIFRPGEPPDPPEPRLLDEVRTASARVEDGSRPGTRSAGATEFSAPSRSALAETYRPFLEPAPANLPDSGVPLRLPFQEAPVSTPIVMAQLPEQEDPGTSVPSPEAEEFEPPLKLKIDETEKSRYAKKKWDVDGTPQVIFGVADDGTFVSRSTIQFSDLLGDYRHYLRLDSVSSFTNIDYAFINLKHRGNWIIHAFDDRDFFLVADGSGGADRKQEQRTTGAEVVYQYPFSLYHRISFSGGLFDRSQDLPFLLTQPSGGLSLEFISSDQRFPLVGMGFTGDTTRFRSGEPYHGRRYNLRVQWAPVVSGDTETFGVNEIVEAEPFHNVLLDFRNYWSWTRRSLFAYRFVGAASKGGSNQIFSFGGFNTLRGYDFREFFGTHISFMNFEIRFPLVDELAFPFGSIRRIRGVIFLDIGAAWFGGGDFCDLALDPDPGNPGTFPDCGPFFDAGVVQNSNKRYYDPRFAIFRDFDFWNSKENKLGDGRGSYGVGFNFYFGPFDLNWIFSTKLPFIQTNPFTGATEEIKDSGYSSAFYIGRKF